MIFQVGGTRMLGSWRRAKESKEGIGGLANDVVDRGTTHKKGRRAFSLCDMRGGALKRRGGANQSASELSISRALLGNSAPADDMKELPPRRLLYSAVKS